MNKYQKDLKSISETLGFNDKRLESYVELVERATSAKVINLTPKLLSKCPKCSTILNKPYNKVKFCHFCGKRLDWSDGQ